MMNIPSNLAEQIAETKIKHQNLAIESESIRKQIELRKKLLKKLPISDVRGRNNQKNEISKLTDRLAKLMDEYAPVKAKLKELHTIDNYRKQQEAAERKERGRREEYNRQFTARMHRLWNRQAREEALERVEQENKALLGNEATSEERRAAEWKVE